MKGKIVDLGPGTSGSLGARLTVGEGDGPPGRTSGYGPDFDVLFEEINGTDRMMTIRKSMDLFCNEMLPTAVYIHLPTVECDLYSNCFQSA